MFNTEDFPLISFWLKNIFTSFFFRSILTSFFCLMSDYYADTYYTLWPSPKCCFTSSVDYSAKFETEEHSISINIFRSSVQKSEIKFFYIFASSQVDFIPLDILSEFPNLNGIIINRCDLPTVKSGLFKEKLQKFEFLYLAHDSLEAILGRRKLSKKTEIGDGSGMVPGVPNNFQSNPVCSFPEQNFLKTMFFQRLSTSRLFSIHISWSNLIYVF